MYCRRCGAIPDVAQGAGAAGRLAALQRSQWLCSRWRQQRRWWRAAQPLRRWLPAALGPAQRRGRCRPRAATVKTSVLLVHESCNRFWPVLKVVILRCCDSQQPLLAELLSLLTIPDGTAIAVDTAHAALLLPSTAFVMPAVQAH
jgi:hypothetical protein